MVVVDPNATEVVQNDTTLDDHASSLRAYLDQQEAHQASLEHELEATKERVARARRAVGALTQPFNKPGRKPAAAEPEETTKPKKTARVTGKNQVWTPKEKTVAKVLAGLEEHGQDGISITGLAAKIGLAGETVRRSMGVLREREQARAAGMKVVSSDPTRNIRAHVFKPMSTVKHTPVEAEEPVVEIDGNQSGFVEALSGHDSNG